MDTWYKLWCPHCNSVNWINNGDTSDFTRFYAEAYKCWKCEKRSFLPGIEDDLMYDEEEYADKQAYLDKGSSCEWGRAHPDDPYQGI